MPTGKYPFFSVDCACIFALSKLKTLHEQKLVTMKNTITSFATAFILFFSFSSAVLAQQSTTWIGGTPGRTQDWNCAQNWSTGKVPDDFSDVTIPDVSTTTFAAPVINKGTVEVNSILMSATAALSIESNGVLVVLNDYNDIKQAPGLKVKGELIVPDSFATDSIVYTSSRKRK